MLQMQSITPFAECPNCRKLLEIESTQCPECRELIPENYAVLSAITNVLNTEACNLAKEIRGSDRIMALVVLGESLPVYWIDQSVFGSLYLFWLTLVPTGMKLVMIAVWYLRFGRFPLGDTNYLRARKQILGSVKLWLPILLLQVAVIVANQR